MLTHNVVLVGSNNDAELVRATLAGDREAFGQIVARYQALICTLSYNATGNLGQSEDLAQETFVTAWKQLAKLQDPEKLRSWLCGIARNLINNSLRKQKREPSHAAESIDELPETHSAEPLPVENTISKDEQAILWRSLEKIPETYRDPLVLFYREHQSVEAVAEKLDLTPDTVHQRLSRGRKLLAEEVMTFVESALTRTNPGQAFTVGVLAALPVTLASSAKAATVAAAAAKGGTTATGKSILTLLPGILFSPLLGFLFGALGFRESVKNTRTPRERALAKRHGRMTLVGAIIFFLAFWLYGAFVTPKLWKTHPAFALAIGWTVIMAWAIFVGIFSWRHRRAMEQLRAEEQRRHPELFRAKPAPETLEYRSRATLFGLPLVHYRSFAEVRRPGEAVKPAVGWIALGQRAYGILYASGGVAVGGIANGGLSIGVIALGGCSIGLLALGGFALGGIALGGGAMGWIASGGVALAWKAALGGMAGAHELAWGGAALAEHVNDPVARQFFQDHPLLDFSRSFTRNLFWALCFGPVSIQMMIWIWWRRKHEKRSQK